MMECLWWWWLKNSPENGIKNAFWKKKRHACIHCQLSVCVLNQQLVTIQRKKKSFSFERNRWGRRKYNNERYFITKRRKNSRGSANAFYLLCWLAYLVWKIYWIFSQTNTTACMHGCMNISCMENYCSGWWRCRCHVA